MIFFVIKGLNKDPYPARTNTGPNRVKTRRIGPYHRTISGEGEGGPEAREPVPGDVIKLKICDIVPADVQFLDDSL